MSQSLPPTSTATTPAVQPATPLDARSRALRRRMLDALYRAGRGHLPSACSCLEMLRTLYDHILALRPHEPLWPERDRCILSKGHGCLALYALLADKGFFPAAELDTFCGFESPLGGHPERGLVPGVEASTGSLGHGLSLGVGMALALRMRGASSRVFVICGDGETNEGSVWEALLSASKHRLSNLCLLVDYNGQQSWDDVEHILPLEPYADKFRAFGCQVTQVNGHHVPSLTQALRAFPAAEDRPHVLLCHTVKGKGFASLERNLAWHHKTRLSDTEYATLIAELEHEEHPA